MNNVTNNYSVPENLIIGGNFDTNPWQRGITFAAVATGTVTADCWVWGQQGIGVVTIAQVADAPTVAQSGMFVQNSLGVTVTTIDATIGNAEFYLVQYRMEGYDWAQIAQNYFTCSFWVKATVTGTYAVSFRSVGVDRCYVQNFTINTTNTWEYKTVTVLPSPTAGTWNYTNGIGLTIVFTLANGSDYFTTAGAWQTGNFLSTSAQVNNMATVNNVFRVDLVKIVKGRTDTPWEVRTEAEELALCQRYYFKTFNQGVTPVQNSGTTVGTHSYVVTNGLGTNGGNAIIFPVSMRTTPTMTAFNPSAANTNWRSITDGSDSGASSFVLTGARGSQVQNAQVLADGAGDVVALHVTASAAL